MTRSSRRRKRRRRSHHGQNERISRRGEEADPCSRRSRDYARPLVRWCYSPHVSWMSGFLPSRVPPAKLTHFTPLFLILLTCSRAQAYTWRITCIIHARRTQYKHCAHMETHVHIQPHTQHTHTQDTYADRITPYDTHITQHIRVGIAGRGRRGTFATLEGVPSGWSLRAAPIRAMAQGTAGVALYRRQKGVRRGGL